MHDEHEHVVARCPQQDRSDDLLGQVEPVVHGTGHGLLYLIRTDLANPDAVADGIRPIHALPDPFAIAAISGAQDLMAFHHIQPGSFQGCDVEAAPQTHGGGHDVPGGPVGGFLGQPHPFLRGGTRHAPGPWHGHRCRAGRPDVIKQGRDVTDARRRENIRDCRAEPGA